MWSESRDDRLNSPKNGVSASNGQKIARINPILTIFGRNRSRRPKPFFGEIFASSKNFRAAGNFRDERTNEPNRKSHYQLPPGSVISHYRRQITQITLLNLKSERFRMFSSVFERLKALLSALGAGYNYFDATLKRIKTVELKNLSNVHLDVGLDQCLSRQMFV